MDDASRLHLRQATAALQLRGLTNSAKWCAEQLVGLEQSSQDAEKLSASAVEGPAAALLCKGPEHCSDRFLLAKTYFDLGEFQRAAFLLQAPPAPLGGVELGDPSASPPSSLRGLPGEELFLKAYALFLAGEKAKEQEALELGQGSAANPGAALERTTAVNPNLVGLEQDLRGLLHHPMSGEGLDAFGLYIYGVVLKELGAVGGAPPQQPSAHRDTAFAVLSESARLFPWNWSCWLDLAEVCVNGDLPPEAVDAAPTDATAPVMAAAAFGAGCSPFPSAASSSAPPGDFGAASRQAAGWAGAVPRGAGRWCRSFFVAHCLVELGGAEECAQALHILEHTLRPSFPHSTYLAAQVGNGADLPPPSASFRIPSRRRGALRGCRPGPRRGRSFLVGVAFQ